MGLITKNNFQSGGLFEKWGGGGGELIELLQDTFTTKKKLESLCGPRGSNLYLKWPKYCYGCVLKCDFATKYCSNLHVIQ